MGTTISNKVNIKFIDKTTNFLLSPFVIDIYEYYDKENNSNTTNPELKPPIDNSSKPSNENKPSLDDDIEENFDEQLTGNVDYSLSSRSYYKDIAKSIIKEHWQFGIGIGSYTHLYNNQNVNNYLENVSYTSFFRYPHNMYCQLGAETGIFGMILFFLTIMIMLFTRAIKSKTLMPLILCTCILLVCYTESIFYMKDIAYFTILIIAFISNKSFISTHKKSYW